MAADAEPLVSVIVACYNQARFLAESIESILNQSYQRHEVIVIDDGSSDHPEGVANAYSQVSFVRQTNQGASATRNAGWHKSRGHFIVFLDADDRLLPNALRAGIDCFKGHPDCGFVFGRGAMIDSNGDRLPDMFPAAVGPVSYETFLEGNSIGFPAVVMCRLSAFAEVGGFNSFLNGAFIGNTSDFDLYLRLASRFPAYGHGNVVAEWRKHGANTSNRSLMMMESAVAVLKGQKNVIGKDARYRAAQRRGLRRMRSLFGEQLIEELRAEARAGNIDRHRFTKSVLALLRHNPQALFANVVRKARLIFSKRSHV